MILLRPQKHRNKECILQLSKPALQCLAKHAMVSYLFTHVPPIGSVAGSIPVPGASSSCAVQLYQQLEPG